MNAQEHAFHEAVDQFHGVNARACAVMEEKLGDVQDNADAYLHENAETLLGTDLFAELTAAHAKVQTAADALETARNA